MDDKYLSWMTSNALLVEVEHPCSGLVHFDGLPANRQSGFSVTGTGRGQITANCKEVENLGSGLL